MNEEREMVLRMLKEGKVTPEEGARLLEELDRAPRGPARHLRVRIQSPSGQKMQFSIPVTIAGSMLGLLPAAAREKLRERGVNLDELLRAVQEGDVSGPLVDIREPSGASVEVVVE